MNVACLYAVWYNCMKQRRTLKGLSPTMAAEISDSLFSTTDLAAMIDIAPPKPGKRGMYKKAIAA
jgi:hypothetical protein